MTTRSRRRAYRILWGLCATIGVPYFRPRVEGLANLPTDRPFIVACNHTTLLDWAALAYFVPRPIHFLITRAYYDRRAFRWFCRLGGALPVTPGRIEPSTLRRALAVLAAGDVIGIFPEGRIRSDTAPLRARRGVIELASKAGVPIVPATIRGAARAFPPTARLPRPYGVTVAFGPPLMAPSAPAPREAQERCAQMLMERIAALRQRGPTIANGTVPAPARPPMGHIRS